MLWLLSTPCSAHPSPLPAFISHSIIFLPFPRIPLSICPLHLAIFPSIIPICLGSYFHRSLSLSASLSLHPGLFPLSFTPSLNMSFVKPSVPVSISDVFISMPQGQTTLHFCPSFFSWLLATSRKYFLNAAKCCLRRGAFKPNVFHYFTFIQQFKFISSVICHGDADKVQSLDTAREHTFLHVQIFGSQFDP